jgi:putative transposase
MMYPLVRDLAVEGVAVRMICGVLGFSTQGYYRWLADPVTDRDWDDAHLINVMRDIHADDPEFGYRFIADELERLGYKVGENRVQRLCAENRIWSVTVRKARKGAKTPGPPVHDDLVERDFDVDRLDALWLTDITEHPTLEGKLYICAIKDACSNRIVGYATGPRMTARLAVGALQLAIIRRDPDGTLVVHSDRGSQAVVKWSSQHLDVRSCRGTTCGMDAAADGTSADAVTGQATGLAA